MTSSWFFLSTLNYDARSTTHRITKYNLRLYLNYLALCRKTGRGSGSSHRPIGRIPRQSYLCVTLFEMRSVCLSLAKTELHNSASPEKIAGDRSEVKRLVTSATTWILQDRCIMIAYTLLWSWKGGETVFRGFFCIQDVHKIVFCIQDVHKIFLYTRCSQNCFFFVYSMFTNFGVRDK